MRSLKRSFPKLPVNVKRFDILRTGRELPFLSFFVKTLRVLKSSSIRVIIKLFGGAENERSS